MSYLNELQLRTVEFMYLSCILDDNLPDLVYCLLEFYMLLLVLHRILAYDVVAQLPSRSILPDGK